MPHINEIKKSAFLKKEDCGRGILVTIESCEQTNVAKEGAPEDLKWALRFREVEKPMVLNSTNAQIIAKICGSEETDDWTGHMIVLYADPNISFGGKLVGGIRARAPKLKTPAPAAPRPAAPRPAAPPPVAAAPTLTAPANAPADPADEDPDDGMPF